MTTVFIMVDGLRPDALVQVAAPSLAGLQAHRPLHWPARLRIPMRPRTVPPMGDWPPRSPIRP